MNSGGRTLRRCKNNGKSKNIILIDVDVDSDNIDHVTIVDVPESLKQKLQGSSVLGKDRKSQLPTIICIDDDDDGEISDYNQPATSDASSSSRLSPSSDQTWNTTVEAGDEGQFHQGNLSPLKLSKCKRTYCRKAVCGNHYGLGLDSDDDQCNGEFMEDTLGELQELWEKANRLKKYGFINGKSDKNDQPTTSGAQHRVEVENTPAQPSKGRVHLNSSNFRCEKEPVFTQTNSQTDHCRISKDKQKTHSAECWSQHSVDTEFGNDIPACSSSFQKGFGSSCSNLVDKENHGCRMPLFQSSNPTGETRANGNDPDNQSKAISRENTGKDPPLVLSERKEDRDETTQQLEDKECDEDGDIDVDQDCLINNREKLKETDEYKRATEQEWESRQQALRIQAEEAQKMRLVLKRKKAESLRLLDMEKRQKQRVEEVREIQKQDEENMNLKEKLRAELRMELQLLEMKSLDMASLLRGLGVSVGGGLMPQPHEIRAAYKKALLIFHPDRAPASDIRKQVEAEEKFKIITRMKERFSPNL